MPPADILYLDVWILFAIKWISFVAGVFAFAHALGQRADAYPAAERMTKPAWLGITGAGTAGLLIFFPGGIGMMFWLAGLVAVLIYLFDVRPKLIEVQRGPRW